MMNFSRVSASWCASHRVRDAEQAVGLGLRFDFGEDAALGIQEKRDVALAGLEVFDVVGEDGVEVAGAVGASEREVGEIVFVDEGDGVFCDFVFVLPVAEVVGECAAEPDADVCAGRICGVGLAAFRWRRFVCWWLPFDCASACAQFSKVGRITGMGVWHLNPAIWEGSRVQVCELRGRTRIFRIGLI